MDTQTPYRYQEPKLTAAWYDLRAFLQARRALLRDPTVALQGETALGFTGRAFARFLWIVLPFGVLAALATVNGLLLEQPNQVFDLNADAAAELRERIAPDASLWRAAGLEPGASEQISEADRQASSEARTALTRSLIGPLLALDNAQIGEAERAATLERIETALREASEGQPPIVQLQLALRVEARLLAAEKRLRFLRRLMETGAANLLGIVFTGLVLQLLAIAFGWWARRLVPVGERVTQAGELMLYLLTARLTPWMLLLVAIMVAIQVAIGWQLQTLAEISTYALLGFSLLMAVAYYRTGRPLAAVLYEAPPDGMARRLGWRMLWVFVLLQLAAALWGFLLALLLGFAFG